MRLRVARRDEPCTKDLEPRPGDDACKPASLILDVHGATESIEVHIGREDFNPDPPLGHSSSWRRAVQGDNAAVITLEGVGLFGNQAADAAFLNEVADRVELIADIDPSGATSPASPWAA